MASILQHYRQLADITALQITGSYQSWTDFLTTAARLYKYPYHEQLMIYAQRPDATACASFDLWNNRMNRNVRRGAKGIAQGECLQYPFVDSAFGDDVLYHHGSRSLALSPETGVGLLI